MKSRSKNISHIVLKNTFKNDWLYIVCNRNRRMSKTGVAPYALVSSIHKKNALSSPEQKSFNIGTNQTLTLGDPTGAARIAQYSISNLINGHLCTIFFLDNAFKVPDLTYLGSRGCFSSDPTR